MTAQERIKELLGKSGIPAKEIKVFGSQILITCYGRPAADRFVSLLAQFATVRGMVESFDYNEVNRNTVLQLTKHKVWRVGAFL